MNACELRPNEFPRLEAELLSVLKEMLSQDPDALNRILPILNKALEPIVDKKSFLV